MQITLHYGYGTTGQVLVLDDVVGTFKDLMNLINKARHIDALVSFDQADGNGVAIPAKLITRVTQA